MYIYIYIYTLFLLSRAHKYYSVSECILVCFVWLGLLTYFLDETMCSLIVACAFGHAVFVRESTRDFLEEFYILHR